MSEIPEPPQWPVAEDPHHRRRAVVMFVLCYSWGERRIHVAGLVSVVTPLSLFLLFDEVLKIRFPRGLITNWYYG